LIVDAADVTVRFRRTDVLRGVTVRFRPGITGLLGPNGAGKTTLLSVLASVLRPSSGVVSVAGHDLASPTGRLHARGLIGWLPQRFDLAGGMTVHDTVSYAAWCNGVDDRGIDAAAQRVLAVVGLSDRARDRVRRLSGGQRQRLGLAAVLAHDPRVLLLDEPTSGLDPEQRVRFLAHVRDVAAGRTVVLSTHLLDDIDRVCERVCVLTDGVVRFDGALAAMRALVPQGRSSSSPTEAAYLWLLAEETAPPA
jgi:ABC-2 type transport system ATP-binding protein